jgi:hypothetical protein
MVVLATPFSQVSRAPVAVPGSRGQSITGGSGLTKAQIAVMEETARRELVDPELDKLERSIKRLNRSSGGLISIEARLERDEPEPAPELDETNDMRRVDFTCHPAETVKVLDDWDRSVHCLICGEPAAI